MLYGRAVEQATIDQLLNGVLDSRPGTLVVRGEAGIGKSALLDYAVASTPAKVLRITGVESEAELPFAALHLLLRPYLHLADNLPAQQAQALRGALGIGDSHGDRFLVGLATLSLLVDLSSQKPLVCIVDDAQWLDSESADALLFAARRLHAEPIAVLFAARSGLSFPATGLTELRLERLDASAAAQLIAESAATLPRAVRNQLIAEADGNPLALMELPRMLTPEQKRGALVPLAFAQNSTEPAVNRVLAGFQDRVTALAGNVRSFLLVAALEDSGELGVLTHAAGLLGASLADAAVAERAGLIQVAPSGLTFRHPLVRAGVLSACDIAARMAAHRALAESVNGDRRAWHLAAITLDTDEEVATQLEQLALRAQQRGGQAAVSAAYARAAELSPRAVDAARRYTAAARTAEEAGLPQRAAELIAQADQKGHTHLTPSIMAELAEVRARLAFQTGRPLDAATMLMEGAEISEDPLTRLSLLGLAGYYAWTSAVHPDQVALARQIEARTPKGHSAATAVEAINHDFRTAIEGGTSVTAVVLPAPQGLPFDLRMIIALQALALADRAKMLADTEVLAEECRDQGRLGRIPQAMVGVAIAQLLDGQHPAARATVANGLTLAADMDQPVWRGYLTGLSAWLCAAAGDEKSYVDQASEAVRHVDTLRWMPARCWAEYAGALLDLGMGRFEAALDRLDAATAGPSRHAFVWRYALPDYIEAAVRSGQTRRVEGPLAQYGVWAETTRQVGALAVLHRARALVADDDKAEALFGDALQLHLQHEQPFDAARTRLLFGEWLRRHQRRAEARQHLELARDAFDRLGSAAWSARASGELRAAGVSVASRVASDPLAVLTPQELQVVQLAVTGATNREIAAQLFLSPRTVGHHLYKAFPKLGVTSRAELSKLVPMLS